MIFSVTAVKVREWEGRPGFWEGLVYVANPRSNRKVPFLVLEPASPSPASAPAAGPVAMEAVKS